jgi:uncharacterized protein
VKDPSRPAHRALRQFVLKVASRCDLACDYCYVYRMADSSWRDQPQFMSAATVGRVARRIADHARAHELREVSIVLHGGEPLLAGADYLAGTARTLRSQLSGLAVDLCVQTHGGLLTESLMQALADNNVTVGVSLDGARHQHDLHRRRFNGRGSYDSTARGLRLLAQPRYQHLYRGLLCVIELANDPVEVYESLLQFEPPAIDFLLPHGNWSRPPPGRNPNGSAPYGDWLVSAFERWYSTAPQETAVRLFEDIINLYLGGSSRSEQVGLSSAEFVVVDTNGALQQVDTLKSVSPGAAGIDMHVETHSMDDVLEHPEIRSRERGLAGLSPTCQECELVRMCGGGSYVHRYRAERGFDNPSVYCQDMQRLIRHVVGRVRADLRDFA